MFFLSDEAEIPRLFLDLGSLAEHEILTDFFFRSCVTERVVFKIHMHLQTDMVQTHTGKFILFSSQALLCPLYQFLAECFHIWLPTYSTGEKL